MKKYLFLGVILAGLTSLSVEARILPQCPGSPCNPGSSECERTLRGIVDGVFQEVKGTYCCREKCEGCKFGEKSIENAQWERCEDSPKSCVGKSICCDKKAETYISGYVSCGRDCAPTTECCPVGESPYNAGCSECDPSKAIQGCCDPDNIYDTGEQGPCGPIQGCRPSGTDCIAPKEKKTTPSGIAICCQPSEVGVDFKGEAICCPSGQTNPQEKADGSALCCKPGEKIAKNDQGDEVCCEAGKIIKGKCGCPDGCEGLIDKDKGTVRGCCCPPDMPNPPVGDNIEFGVLKKETPKNGNEQNPGNGDE